MAGAGETVPGGYTLVVAVSNPATVDQLMRTAVDLAADRDGGILAVSVVHKPPTSPFSLFSETRIKAEYADAQQAVLDAAVAAAADDPVPVRKRVLVGTDVAAAIRSAVREADADGLLLGWQEPPGAADVVLGTTVDPVLRRAPCDVFVERVGRTADGLEGILLPTVGGPHVPPATDLAGAVARANDASVSVVSYVSPDADDAERTEARGYVESAGSRLEGVTVDAEVREAVRVTKAIEETAAGHDLVVLGATRERGFRRRVVGSVAAAIGERVTPPVVIAKRGPERSVLRRALEFAR